MDVVTLSMAKAYTDSQRLAYTEGGKIMWDVELVPMEGTGFTYFQELNTDQTVLSVGKTYTVTTDSGSFTTVCKEMSGVVFLGNGSILGITGVEDSGENFLVAVDKDHVMGFFDFNGGSRMEISTAATIHPIDPKFWAIETMETVFVHGAEFSERDAAILNAYASQKLPIFIRAKLQISDTYTMECAAVFTLLLAPDRTVYSAVASNARVDVIQYEDLNGGWVASLTTGT